MLWLRNSPWQIGIMDETSDSWGDREYWASEQLFRTNLGSIWRGVHTESGTRVLIERIATGKALASVRAMLDLHQRLAGPGIVDVEDACLDGNQPYVVWRANADAPLGLVLRDEGGIAVELVLELARETLEILDRIHSAGEVHGGLAIHRVLKIQPTTLSGVLGCTADLSLRQHMPPMDSWHSKSGPEADLFTLGAMTWQLLARRPGAVSKAFDPGAIGRLAWPPSRVNLLLSTEVDAFISALVSPDRDGQPLAAGDALDLLDAAVAHQHRRLNLTFGEVSNTSEWKRAMAQDRGVERDRLFSDLARTYPWIDECWDEVRMPSASKEAYRAACIAPHDRRGWIAALAAFMEDGQFRLAEGCLCHALDPWIPERLAQQLLTSWREVSGRSDSMMPSVPHSGSDGSGPSGVPARVAIGPPELGGEGQDSVGPLKRWVD